MKNITIDLINSNNCEGLLKQRDGKHFESDCMSCYLFSPQIDNFRVGKCNLKGCECGEGYTCSEWAYRKSLIQLNEEAGLLS